MQGAAHPLKKEKRYWLRRFRLSREQRAALKAHMREIAKILHEDAKEKGMPVESLGEIEQTVRQQLQTHVSPELVFFYR